MITLYLALIDDEDEKTKYLALYNRYKYRMLTIANSILADRGLAEDAVQDSFLYLALHISSVETVNSPKTRNYIDLVVKHKAIDLVRKRKPEINVSDLELEYLSGGYNHVEKLIMDKLAFEKAFHAIMSLPESYRECLELHIVYELPAKAISALIHLPYETVKKRLQRGKELLRKNMQ